MYIPSPFRVCDLSEMHNFIESQPFAILTTVGPDGFPFATHLPLLLNPEAGETGSLQGHMARANPQWQHFRDAGEALAIFAGPHAYISPAWYEVQPSVPTWNYTAVHVYGMPRILDGDELRSLLYRVTAAYEGDDREAWGFEMPDNYVDRMADAVVGFEMPISRIEGKFKLSQNRSAEDRCRVAAALGRSDRASDREMSLLVVPANDTTSGTIENHD